MANWTVFKNMIESQKILNDEITENWFVDLSKEDFLFAAFVEAGEAGSSINYKWWKAEKNDWDNLKVELIDILHFLLSALLYDNEVQRMDANYFFERGLADTSINKNTTEEERIELIKLNLLKLLKFDNVTAFLYLGRLFRIAGITDIKVIAKNFVIKNVLNLFRTKNGYKEGTYIKIWNGKEDNEIVYNEIAPKLKFGKYFYTDLYKKIEEYYNEFVKTDF